MIDSGRSETNISFIYNSDGNVCKVKFKGRTNETIYEYEYDKMISPFINLDLPISFYSGFFDIGTCFSFNNIISKKITEYKYSYWGDTTLNVSYLTNEYKYQNGYPIERNGQYIFKYAYLN